ncbi:hypothetical protein TRIUR3_06412 [Triticum urartu]|uniref:Uncharacterized protein n=1 Tax=Triticum urartu TaxID=4572 RepID=M7YNI5_TRIUA|nr:hypothetical protein TRIUR3_06412 [Triticum urartu]
MAACGGFPSSVSGGSDCGSIIGGIPGFSPTNPSNDLGAGWWGPLLPLWEFVPARLGSVSAFDGCGGGGTSYLSVSTGFGSYAFIGGQREPQTVFLVATMWMASPEKEASRQQQMMTKVSITILDQPLVVARDVLLHSDTAVDSHAYALVVRGQEDVRPKMAMSGTPSHAYATGEGDDDGVTVKARLTASRSLAREERAARRRRSRSHSHALVPDPVVQDKSVVVVRDDKLRRTATEGRRQPTVAEEEESEYYARLSDEELNRRVEDFITRFNREIRLQVEKEELQA